MPRPGWVTFVAVMEFIGGGFAVLYGLMLLVGGSLLAGVFGSFGAAFGAILLFFGVLVLAIGVLEILLGVNVLRGRNWARVTTLVLTIIGLAFGVLGLLMAVGLMAAAGDASMMFSMILGLPALALNILILVALTRPESKAYFGVPA